MGKNEINEFLSYLATERHVSASTQNQALGALLFLYRHVLNMEVELGNNIVRVKRNKHIPVVFTRKKTV
jgi:site-specific recombinase XerD